MEDIVSIQKASELSALAEAALTAARLQLEGILAASGPLDADNVLRPLNSMFLEFGDVRRGIGLLRSVHPDEEIRSVAERCEQQIAEFYTELSLNRKLFERIKSCDVSKLDAVGRRLHEHSLRDFRRSGVDRDEETRRKVQEFRSELVKLGQEFSRNILSDVRSIELDGVEDLDGLPDDYIRDHPPGEDGKIRISTDYPDYNPFMTYARSGDRRRELYIAFRNRAHPGNVDVLDRLIALRYELARLLGYANWADYSAEDKMIKKAESIDAFIRQVSDSAAELSIREYEQLLERKRRDDPSASRVYDWEKGYYEYLFCAEHYHADKRELRSYFDYRTCMDGILETLERLFSIEFRKSEDARRWHEDVEVRDVFEGGEQIGRLFLDMHPREGKFKHAAMFPLVQGVRDSRPPEAALVCNFPKPPGDGGPALLEHDDVVTMFHELGHLLHHIFGVDTEWEEFSGTGTEWDFVEVPSQLLEEWAWDATVLQGFAKHVETGETLSEDLLARHRSARDFGRGLSVRQQMFYASLSLECHSKDPDSIRLEDLQESLQNEFSRFAFVAGTHFHLSFGHLEGYSALYYTYMWSLVIEKDLFSMFREGAGVMDASTASHYRRSILAPGGSKDAPQLIRDFLGRDYTFEAFESWLASDGQLALESERGARQASE